MRQLRVENTLYALPDDVWRQVNDLLGPYADSAKNLEVEKKDPGESTGLGASSGDQRAEQPQPSAGQPDTATDTEDT